MTDEYDYLFKVLMIGDSGSGKSSMLLQFAEHEFAREHIATIGVDFKIRTIDLDGKRAKLQIWDTAGQERFRTITNSYYHGAQGVLVVFDVTHRGSFEHVGMWLEEIKRHSPKTALVLVCGNKVDLRHRQVEEAEAIEFCAALGVPYIETSAKNSHNIDAAFRAMVVQLRNQRIALDAKGHLKRLKFQGKRLDDHDEAPASSCC